MTTKRMTTPAASNGIALRLRLEVISSGRFVYELATENGYADSFTLHRPCLFIISRGCAVGGAAPVGRSFCENGAGCREAGFDSRVCLLRAMALSNSSSPELRKAAIKAASGVSG